MLRQLVYDSVCDGRLLPPPPGVPPRGRPSAARQLLGSLASFAASGLAHEGIFWWAACWHCPLAAGSWQLRGATWMARLQLAQAAWLAAALRQRPRRRARGMLLPRSPGRHLTGRTSRGVWLFFFLAQVPAITVERLGG